MSFQIDNMNQGAQPSGQGPAIHYYENTSDTLSTIEGDGYFDPVAPTMDQGDLLFCLGSDGKRAYRVVNASDTDVNLAPVMDDRVRIYFNSWDPTSNSLFLTTPFAGDIKRLVVIQEVNVDADTDIGLELDDTNVTSGGSAVAVTVTNSGAAGDVHKDEGIDGANSVSKDADIEVTTDGSATAGLLAGYVELRTTGLH